jgi:hypothetical protein
LKSLLSLMLVLCTSAFVATRLATTPNADLTRLPLGDGRLSDAPRAGNVWSCASRFGGGGAFRRGSWIRDDGTYDFTAKPTVDGTVKWPSQFTITREGEHRLVVANDLPDHPTGAFPISPSDDAFQWDRNPNAITAQDVRITMPLVPAPAAQPSCLPMGPIGVLLSGAYLFNALDARGEDAVAHEIQDGCQGHPERMGAYHYHSLTTCLTDSAASNAHSSLVGYAFDGFGVYGRRGDGGRELTNADLDECHGHTHAIVWDGERRVMYHYHATWEYPYTIGCYRASPVSGGRRGPPG